MSEQTNNDPQQDPAQIVDNGGEQLDNILNEELSSGDESPIPTSDGSKPETKEGADADSQSNDDPSEDAGGEEQDETPSDDEQGSEESDDGDAPNDKGKKPSRVAKKVKKLLHQRNSYKHERDELLEENERLKAKIDGVSTDEDPDLDDDSDDDHDENDAPIDEVIDRKLDERDQQREQQKRKQDQDAKERAELVDQYNPTSDELDAIDEIIKDNPKLSDEAALKIVNPAYFVEDAQLNRANAEKLGSGTQPRRDLRMKPSVQNMSDAELDKEFERQLEEGSIVL